MGDDLDRKNVDTIVGQKIEMFCTAALVMRGRLVDVILSNKIGMPSIDQVQLGVWQSQSQRFFSAQAGKSGRYTPWSQGIK